MQARALASDATWLFRCPADVVSTALRTTFGFDGSFVAAATRSQKQEGNPRMIDVAPPILVVGATGRHGGTGAGVANELLDCGVPIRAITRTLDHRVAALKRRGVDVLQADLHDRLSLIKALKGIETAYFTYPIAGGIVEAAANFASAGRATGLKRIVTMSMGPAHPNSPSHLGRAQWLAEELFETAGFQCLHLRIAAAFLENIVMLHTNDVRTDRIIRNSFPDIPVSWIMGADAARIATAAILHPERFAQGPAIYPGSPYQYKQSDIAQILGGFLNRKLSHETISAEAWRERIIELSAKDSRLNADMAAHISSVAAALEQMQPLPPNDMIEQITGAPPLSLEEALQGGRLVFDLDE